MASKEKKTEEKVKKHLPEESIYLNRELSWLSFNLRVLQEAADPSVPLLERLKFLMIYQSNLSEFYRVRMGILTHRALLTPEKSDPLTGMSPEEQIREVLKVTREQQSLMESIWKGIREELKKHQIDVLDFKKISKVDELMSKKLFGDIKDLLFPKIISMNQPLPFLWNGEQNVVAFLGRGQEQRMAILQLHRLPAYLSFEIDGRQKIVLTAQLVRHFLPLLLKKEDVTQTVILEVTRNADVFLSGVQNSGDKDLKNKVASMLSKRKREMPTRVRLYGKLSDNARAALIKKLRVPERYVFTQSVPFDLSFRSAIGGHEEFRYPDRKPVRDLGLKKGEYFDYIRAHDLLLSYPFQSMLPFVDLLYEAADDPEVLSIQITLYRMSSSSKIAAALAYAADRGKDVLCLLELRARFDEQNNIDYSELLEDAGCRVIYGLPDYKVHSKLCLITLQRDGNLQHITQVGTGNYNENTGEQYTDLSLITADEAAARDAEAALAAMAEGQLPPEAETLWIAPLSFENRVLELLDRETEKGENGRVAIKVNAMNNLAVMEKLIQCSQAGVQVELFIRGICCLRPGVPGQTENITVKSVVGRWLEHSRVYSFGDGDDQRLFLGSGDLLNRNLERRVEAFMEVKTPETRAQVMKILDAFRADREKSRIMQPDGTYLREPGGEGTSSQEALYQYFSHWNVHQKPTEPEPPEAELSVLEEIPILEEIPEPEVPEAEIPESEPPEPPEVMEIPVVQEIPVAQTIEPPPVQQVVVEYADPEPEPRSWMQRLKDFFRD